MGISYHVWGVKRVSDARPNGIGKLDWSVDKGTGKGILIYTYGVLPPETAPIDTTRMTLLTPPDANIGNGDKIVVGGATYYADGDVHSWKIYKRELVHHLEIPLKSVP